MSLTRINPSVAPSLQVNGHRTDTRLLRRTAPGGAELLFWLLLSLPIALLAIAGSVLGLTFENTIYGRETADWAAQAVGQDIANLLAFPAMLVAAYFAARGSTKAHLVWMGLLVYSAYSYAIFTFALHFGPLFLLWVAVFGLSVYALIGAFTNIDAIRVRDSIAGTGEGFAARLLVVIGSAFALLWLSEILPAMFAGDTPDALKEVGLLTNPVHVLDLALFLPALVIGGVLLARQRPLGYVLAPVLLVATSFLAIGIVSLMLVSVARDIESAPAVGVAVALLALIEALAAWRLLRNATERD
jgi:hypothetical protein